MAADVVPARPLGDLGVGRVVGVARPRVAGAARVALDGGVGAVAAVAAPAAAARATAGPKGRGLGSAASRSNSWCSAAEAAQGCRKILQWCWVSTEHREEVPSVYMAAYQLSCICPCMG